MKHARPDKDDARVGMQPDHARLLSDLYILSSAAAQLGGYGLDVPNSQWRALVQQTQAARTAVGKNEGTGANDGHASLGQLITMCEDIIELYTTGQRCPPAIWREVGRLGRDAYAYVCAGATCQREPPSD